MARPVERQVVKIRCLRCSTVHPLGWEIQADNMDIWIQWATTGEARNDITFRDVEMQELYRLTGICSHCNDREAT
jgi:hypothetical protein